MENRKGITLIALVVTIIVLLILAGITITLLLSDDGIISKADKAAYETDKAVFEERLGLANLDAQGQKAINGGLTAEEYFEILKKHNIISDTTVGGDNIQEKGKDAEENTIYEITSDDGHVFEAVIDKEGNIETEYQGKKDNLPPVISGITTSKTTNSIEVKVTVNRLEDGDLRYYIKKESDEKYPEEPEETSKNTSHIFEGLEQNVVYNIKVVVENSKGRDEEEVNERTGELLSGTITQKGETTWSNGEASIELETTETGYTMQYQVNSTEGTWQEYIGPITGLHHNDKVFARLWDETNGSGETAITILDGINPTVTVTKGIVATSSIQVSVSSSDNESGMPASPTYSYYIKPTSQGTYPTEANHTGTETSYTFSGLQQNTSYDVKVTVQDNAGNTGEETSTGISTTEVGGAEEGLEEGNITLKQTTWSNNRANITLSTSTNFMIQYKEGSSGTWTPASYTSSAAGQDATVTGLAHNTIVYARLMDDTGNTGSEASVTIQDGIAPAAATIDLSSTSTTTGTAITATVTHTDNESGVATPNSKYIYNTTSGNLGTTNALWDTATSFSSNPEPLTLSASSPGTYFLHVLTVDNAGNSTEKTSEAVTVTQLVTGISLNQTTATITEGETLQLTATISPDNASNKAVTWESSSTNIATVSASGLVTAVSEGTTTITVKANDGSNVSATCNVTVESAGMSASDIADNPTAYYGKTVSGYTCTNSAAVANWKIFYAGNDFSADGSYHVYLIADDYISYRNIPESSDGNSLNEGASSYPSAAYFTNILGDYTGSASITDSNIKKLNDDYFSNGYSSTSNNMKSVAYMLDTNAWSVYKGEDADYAVGGPSIEMLMKSYSQKHDVDYRARASRSTGYQISDDGGGAWLTGYQGMLTTSDSLYVITSTSDAYGYWIASPSAGGIGNLVDVYYDGRVINEGYNRTDKGFRPLVCLSSDVKFEQLSNGNFEIK